MIYEIVPFQFFVCVPQVRSCPPRGRSGAGVGVGMLRGEIALLEIKNPWFLCFLVSWFRSFSVSWFQICLVSKFLGFKVSWFQSVLVSCFQSSKVPKFQRFRKSINVSLEDIGPILPNVHVMFSGRY